ncbi:MAG: RHS repeat-associated core domain-containing protein [Verrucomicrobiota bacterium]
MNTTTLSKFHLLLAGLSIAATTCLNAQTDDWPDDTPLWQCAPATNSFAMAVDEPAPYQPNTPQPYTPNPAASNPEIVSLAASLGNDPVKIYDYVRNHIEYTCYDGSRKGAVLTLLEGSGNDYDQCALLIALLNAADYTQTQYCKATMGMPYTGNNDNNVMEWLGLPDEPRPGQTFYQAFGYGLPAGMTDLQAKRLFLATNYFNRFGLYSGWWPTDYGLVGVKRTWVQLTVNDIPYQLDPAFKRYEEISGLDFATLSGYNRNSLLSAVSTTAADSLSYQGLDDSKLRNGSEGQVGLVGLTATLLGTIRNDYPGLSVDEIVSGRRIVPVDHASLSAASFDPGGVTVTRAADIWDADFSSIQFSIGTTNLYTAKLADLAGGRLSLTFNGNIVSLNLDDSELANTTVSTTSFSMKITVTHPGSIGSTPSTATYTKANGYMYALLYSFNASGRLIQQRQDILKAYRDANLSDSSPQVRCESLNIMGLNWMRQTQLLMQTCAACGGVAMGYQHSVGRMAQESGYYIDVSNQYTSVYSRTAAWADEEMYFQMPSLVASAMEHGVIEQLQPGASATSTINILRAANTAGQKIYMTSPANWSVTGGVKSKLTSYPTSALTQLDSYLSASSPPANRSLLPANGNVTQGIWKGTGYVIRASNVSGMIISGGYQGGYSTATGVVLAAQITQLYDGAPQSWFSNPSVPHYTEMTSTFTEPPVYGGDPVDMATGAFTYGRNDMETGLEGAPRGLSFSRSYSSLRHTHDDQYLGKGWSHNLDMRANVFSAAEESLGLGTPEQCAPLLVAITVMRDLYRQDASPKEWGIAVHTAAWLVDMMTNGAVSVHVGPQVFQFIKMPDGSYIPPAGSTSTLTFNSTTNAYQLAERLGNVIAFDQYNRAYTITDPDGKQMIFHYNGSAADSTINYVEDAYNRRYTFGYTGTHITSVTDSTGRSVSFGYDTANGNLTSATDPEIKTAHFDYALDGDPTTQAALSYIRKVRDRKGDTVIESDYDSLGRVCAQRAFGDPAKTTTLHYTGFRTDEINPAHGVMSYLFDDHGRSAGTIPPDLTTNSWIYDGQNQIVHSTNGAGKTTDYQYYPDLNIKRIDYPEGGGSKQFFYDALSRLTDTIDQDGRTVTRQYETGNSKNRPDHIVDAVGTTNYTYKTTGGGLGRVWKITDPDNLVAEYEYDSFGQPLWVKKPGGFTTNYTITPRGDITDISDPKAVITHTVYNARRQPTQVVHDYNGANSATEDLDYNDEGLPQTHTAPPDNNSQRFASTTAYSATGKVLKTTFTSDYAPAPYEENTYDSRDWQDHSYDIARRQTNYTPNATGLLLDKVMPLGRVISQTQDGIGRVTTFTSPGAPANRVKQVFYGVTGTGDHSSGCPKTTLTTADQLTATTELTPSGKIRFHKDRRANVWEFRYDNAGRPTHVISPTDAAAGKAWVTQYTPAGRLSLVTAPSNRTTGYSYNATTGRPLSVTDGVGTTNFSSFDNNGNILTLSETRGGQTYTTGKTYDRLNRLASRTDENGTTVGYQYYPSGKLQLLVYPGGNATTKSGCVEYTYWKSGRLNQVIDRLSAITRTTTYTWYADGRLASIASPNNTRREIQYDDAGRPDIITESTTAGKLIHLQKLTYYPSDEVATRYVIPSFGGGKATPAPPLAGLTFDASNQLATVPGKTVSYDPDGNMTHGPLPDGSQGIFDFDARNRLTGAGGSSVTYDAESMRKTVTEAGVTTSYVMDASGAGKVLTRTKGGVTTRYVWGVGLCYEVNAAGASTTYHYDAIGSTIALTDDTAKIIERVDYSPYGLVTRRWNSTGTYHDTPFLYTGMLGNETDANGLVYMRARYYHPLLGRFINGDPARAGWNWHAYAGGNPLGYVDPSGLGADRALDIIQTALSFVGLVPGIGIAADVLNAGVSLGRGNYGEAAMYGAGALTCGVLGMVASMEVRAGARLEAGLAREAAEGTETFYRTMSQEHYEQLLNTGKIPATGETFISPSLQYAQKYSGATVQFNIEAGTTDALMGMGVRNSARGFAGSVYEGLPAMDGQWTASSAYFKWEKGVVNIGLGQGSALETFNKSIVNFNLVP